MLGLLERNITSIEQRLVLLAPQESAVPTVFDAPTLNSSLRNQLLHELQRLRGAVYVADGAIRPDALTPDGRHQTPEDDQSWHLLMLDARRRVSACVWYREHDADASIEHLRVHDCPLRREPSWREVVTEAVTAHIEEARQHALRYVEVGGWAVAPENRRSSEGLMLALGAYSLGRLLGGALGLTTATVRHCSSTILRRLGGSHFEARGVVVPPYYDPSYDCTMELLQFDSRKPNPKYTRLVELLKAKLAQAIVLADPVAVPANEPCGVLSLARQAEYAA